MSIIFIVVFVGVYVQMCAYVGVYECVLALVYKAVCVSAVARGGQRTNSNVIFRSASSSL